MNIRVIKLFVIHSQNCNTDLKGFIKIRSILASSVSIKWERINVFYLGGRIRRDEYVITGVEMQGDSFETEEKY